MFLQSQVTAEASVDLLDISTFFWIQVAVDERVREEDNANVSSLRERTQRS